MLELAAELLAARGVAVTAPSLSRLLCAAGFSYKKTLLGRVDEFDQAESGCETDDRSEVSGCLFAA
jgi:transposase